MAVAFNIQGAKDAKVFLYDLPLCPPGVFASKSHFSGISKEKKPAR